MRLEVFRPVVGPSTAPGTRVLAGPVSRVDLFVAPQLGTGPEAPVTNLALVGSLPRVSAAVSNQLEVVPEHLVTSVELTPQLVHNVSLGVLH